MNVEYKYGIPYGGGCYPTSSERWERGGTPRRPSCRATPHGLDQRSKMEEVVAVPAPLFERWAEMARQLRRGADHSVTPNRLELPTVVGAGQPRSGWFC